MEIKQLVLLPVFTGKSTWYSFRVQAQCYFAGFLKCLEAPNLVTVFFSGYSRFLESNPVPHSLRFGGKCVKQLPVEMQAGSFCKPLLFFSPRLQLLFFFFPVHNRNCNSCQLQLHSVTLSSCSLINYLREVKLSSCKVII